MNASEIHKRLRLIIKLVAGFSLCFSNSAIAQLGQKGQNSELLVTYDYTKPESKTEIPFDKYFTLQLLHFNTEKIHQILVYEAVFIKGEKKFKKDPQKDGSMTPVYDFEIPDYLPKHDTLLLYFPPVKPDKEFDIVVKRGLTAGNLVTAMKLNEAIASGPAGAQKLFDELTKGILDDTFNVIAIKIHTLDEYKAEFTNKFVMYYNHLKTSANFPSVSFLTIENLNLMYTCFNKMNINYKWGYIPARLINENKIDDMFAGNLPADFDSGTNPADAIDFKTRVANLTKSIAIMDTLNRNINTYLYKDNDPDLKAMLLTVENVTERLKKNKKFINDEITSLTKEIQSDKNLEEVEVVVGGTRAKDIKTEGTNIFTLDLGLATVGSWNSRNQFAALPKLYYGVNIYFRPINKNTRRENMPGSLQPDYENGPDYRIASQRSMWQHLSLTIGFTTGNYRNTEFDNLYNSTTLLVGGGYRFYRAFKVTAGAAFLRRASNNPVITDKGLFVGPYLSFSADIDLVDTIKNVISPLWK